MIRRLLLAAFFVSLAGLASARPSDMEDLIRASNAAFERGDLEKAGALLEQAQRLAPDPRLVAFNLATVRYEQAKKGEHGVLGEAEVLYRCCLEAKDPRRAEAFLGLGNCLLLRGSSGKLDALSLRAAIDRFTQCRREPGVKPDIEWSAQWNQQRARLLLLQAVPPAEASEQPPGEDPDNENPDQPPGAKTSDPRNPESNGKLEPDPTTKPDKDAKGIETDQANPKPGRGAGPPPPDDRDAPPIASTDAASHLEEAIKRISADWIQHRRGRTRPSSPGVRDW